VHTLCLDPIVAFLPSLRLVIEKVKEFPRKKANNTMTMTKQYSSLVVLALVLLCPGAHAADPLVTSIQIGPQTPDPIAPGGTATYSITVTKSNTSPMNLNLSIPDLPPEASASFFPNPLNLSSAATAGTATVTISTTSAIAPGSHPFSVVAQDGQSHVTGTNSATLDVASGAPGLIQLSDGSWCFTFATEPGKAYDIQASTNFPAPVWTTLCTTNSGTNNLMVFINRDVAKCPCRFYRTVPK
jgi:hypothetical protein